MENMMERNQEFFHKLLPELYKLGRPKEELNLEKEKEDYYYAYGEGLLCLWRKKNY